jgi:hypothetical protein
MVVNGAEELLPKYIFSEIIGSAKIPIKSERAHNSELEIISFLMF